MRRSIILSTVLTAGVAVLGACDPKVEPPKPPVSTPAPTATSSPVTTPSASPTGSPVKASQTPDGKKADAKDANKNAKPATAETPKTK